MRATLDAWFELSADGAADSPAAASEAVHAV